MQFNNQCQCATVPFIFCFSTSTLEDVGKMQISRFAVGDCTSFFWVLQLYVFT